jgi:DoxX-like family
MGFSGITSILNASGGPEVSKHLGYPFYLIAFLGVAKLLGVVTTLIPGFPRPKEWAYAGFVFDLAGAMYSGISVGDPASQ